MTACGLAEVTPSTNDLSTLRMSTGQVQQAERRVAGAEVVQRDPACRGRAVPARRPAPPGAEHRGLGDLGDQQRGRAGLGQHRRDRSAKPGSLSCRAEMFTLTRSGPFARRLVPAGGLPDHLVQDPAAELDDVSVALGERDEHRRRDQPVLRMLPADQRLDRGEPAGGSSTIGW